MLKLGKSKSRKLFSFDMKVARENAGGRGIVISMRIYEVTDANPKDFPDGLKFRWIAFDEVTTERRVLIDCHAGKGPHIHIDADDHGKAFLWTGIDDAIAMFIQEIERHFEMRIEITL